MQNLDQDSIKTFIKTECVEFDNVKLQYDVKEEHHSDSDQNDYPCKFCDKLFATKAGLSLHEKQHRKSLFRKRSAVKSDDKPFKCEECHTVFKSLTNLKRHLHIHKLNTSGSKPFKCKKVYSNYGTLRTHEQHHANKGKLNEQLIGIKRFKCDICNKRFSLKRLLQSHKKVHSDSKPYQCNSCGKLFTHKTSLVYHQRLVHTKERPYKCDRCDKTFALVCLLKRHKRDGHLIVCKYCDGKFTKHQLKQHEATVHVGQNPFKCAFCDESFLNRKDLIDHKLQMKKINSHGKYACKTCKKRFAQKSALQVHKKIHFTCDICGKAFSDLTPLKKHKIIHIETKAFECMFCGRKYATEAQLDKHEPSHIEEKHFQCEFCEKTFKTEQSLFHHKTLHTGEKPYDCEICGKFFRLSTNYYQHRKLHTISDEKRSVKCNICDRIYLTKRGLKDHMRKHLGGERRFPCSMCDKTFARKPSLLQHEARHSRVKTYRGEIVKNQLNQFISETNQ